MRGVKDSGQNVSDGYMRFFESFPRTMEAMRSSPSFLKEKRTLEIKYAKRPRHRAYRAKKSIVGAFTYNL
jgi:hypothetical protein